MPSPETRQVLGVLGMHRSGTSLVARVLNLVGFDLGHEEGLLEPRFDNPRGYWEQRPIMDINDAILEALGGSWSQPPEMPPRWTERPDIEAIATRAREVVVSQFGDSELWAWKDPRASLTLPFWRSIVPEPRWIVCMRSPVDVAASLLRRDPTALTWDEAIGLWLRHSAEALEHTAKDERLVLFYEDWFVDLEAQLARLMSFLGRDVASAPPSVHEDIHAYIDTGQRHHRSTALEVAQMPGLSGEARAFYLSLRAADVLSTVTATDRADLAAGMEPGLPEALELVAPSLRHGTAARAEAARLREERGEAVSRAQERDRLLAAAEREREEAIAESQRTRDSASAAARDHRAALERIQGALELAERALGERDEALARAREERDQALARAREERDEAVTEAQAERDRLVAAAERERDEAVAESQRTRDSASAAARDHQAAVERTQRELEQTRQRLEKRQATAAGQDRELAQARAALNRERRERQGVIESASWRLTRPLRAGKRGLAKLRPGNRANEPTAPQEAPSRPLARQHARAESRASTSEPAAGPDDSPPNRRHLRAGRPARARQRARDEARALFDVSYYSAQAGAEFASANKALDHYLETGHREGFDPYPLFYGKWYLGQHPEVAAAGENPLLAFFEEGVADGHDPNPYFDTEYYYSQRPAVRERGESALSHYVENAAANRAANPNPLFGNGFYLNNHPDARKAAATPFEHFLTQGWRERRAASAVHRNLLAELRKTSSALWRGRWRRNRVLLFTAGDRIDTQPNLFELADRLSSDPHLGCVVVALRRATSSHGNIRALVLEDFEGACPDILRPSALRLLTYSVAALRPALAISDVTEVVETLRATNVGTYFVLPDAAQVARTRALDEAVDCARRTLVPSSEAFHAARSTLGRYPANVALRPAPHRGENGAASTSLDDYVESVVGFAARDFGLDTSEAEGPPSPPRKIIAPCSDWNVSGVNTSLEALGLELIQHGWEVEIVFTRHESVVVESAGGEANMPKLPYRYLSRDEPGVMGMWEALIADLEQSAPCILFTAYDFLANAVAPALTDKVGVVAWAQSDDGDYYEQVYRLGRYCNAVVCVSHHIADQVSSLNPAIGELTHVIPNASVWERDVVETRPEPGAGMRLIYTGRLVQYQKRVLDFIALAQALERTHVPFEISLAGTFPAREETTRRTFEERARPYLEDGRISLLGRKSRDELLAELAGHDFFVLLSDFEGLPLSLVEAMARGCVPVVAESPSGVAEVVTSADNGFLISGRDYHAWAQLLVETWQDREKLARLSERARATVREAFTVEQTARRFVTLFQGIATEIESGTYRRPDSLHWGEDRSVTGDVLPPPNLHRPTVVQVAGLH